jgi:hypothetical protein
LELINGQINLRHKILSPVGIEDWIVIYTNQGEQDF